MGKQVGGDEGVQQALREDGSIHETSPPVVSHNREQDYAARIDSMLRGVPAMPTPRSYLQGGGT